MPLTQERTQACSARLSADGRKIILGPGPAAWTEFCQSLPGARWSQFDCRWMCDFTPAAAWRIGCFGMIDRAYLSEEIQKAARRFSAGLEFAYQAREATTLQPPPIHKTAPWSHQKTAYWFAHPLDAALLAEGMGCGKTLTAIDLIVNWDCKTILILCPLSVRGVWQREIDKHAGRPIAVCIPKGSTKCKTSVADDMLRIIAIAHTPTAVVMNYDAAKMEPFASWSLGREWDCVILDESHRCLPAGVLIDTPVGKLPIETIKPGDFVLGLNHATGCVVATKVSAAMSLLTNEKLVQVGDLTSTVDHSIWTKEYGYVSAEEIDPECTICYLTSEGVSYGKATKAVCVRTLRSDVSPGNLEEAAILRKELQPQASVFDESLAPGAIAQEHATAARTTGGSRQDSGAPCFQQESVSQRDSADCSGCRVTEVGIPPTQWRQRSVDGTAEATCSGARLADGICCSDEQAKMRRLPQLLQDRRGESAIDDRGGSGWLLTPNEDQEGRGSQERRTADFKRVDGASILELGNHRQSRRSTEEDSGNHIVYNIETQTENYFAGGILVHNCKSHSSLTSKYAAKLGQKAKRRLCLTGTPLAQSPLDLFGQFRFLDPGLFGTSWHHFSNRYAIRGNPYIPQQITGYKNQEELQERFRLISYRCKASDVLDLPEAMHEERTFELSPAARKAYKQLEEELIADLGTGVCVAANCLVRLLRLQQITSGFLLEDETKKPHILDTGKLEILGDLLDDLQGEPLVVFCRFRHDLEIVRTLVELKKLRYGELSGSSKDGLTDRGEMSPNINVLGAQVQSGGLGVDLTRARIAVYMSLGFSLSDYEQTLARLHRPGQTRNVLYLHLIAENTVDRHVYSALRARKDVIEAVLEGFQDSDYV